MVVSGADRRTLTDMTHQGEEWFTMNQNPAADVVSAGKRGTAVQRLGLEVLECHLTKT